MAINTPELTITGYLGRDPDIRQGAKGDWAILSVAAAQPAEPQPTWHRVVVWQALVPLIAALKKGAALTVVGHQQTRTWSNNQGIDQQTTELVASHITLPSVTLPPTTPAAPPPAAYQPSQQQQHAGLLAQYQVLEQLLATLTKAWQDTCEQGGDGRYLMIRKLRLHADLIEAELALQQSAAVHNGNG